VKNKEKKKKKRKLIQGYLKKTNGNSLKSIIFDENKTEYFLHMTCCDLKYIENMINFHG